MIGMKIVEGLNRTYTVFIIIACCCIMDFIKSILLEHGLEIIMLALL